MPPVPSRLRRVVLRSLVLVQLAVLALVALTIRDLVNYGTEITPGAVLIVVTMMACAVVAMRATFRRGDGERGHRLVFMSAQVVALLVPLVGRESLLTFVAAGSILPPNVVYGPEYVFRMMGLEVLFAAVVGAVAALLAPLLLPPPTGSPRTSPIARALIVWAGGAAIVVGVAGALYGAHFSQGQSPSARVQQMFTDRDPMVQRAAAQNLASLDLSAHPEVRAALVEALTDSGSVNRAWAAYVLVASGHDDDARAMDVLRRMVTSYTSAPAVQSLTMLGEAAGPAAPELARLLSIVPDDALVAAIQTDAAEALAQIGPPAAVAIPSLVERAREAGFPALRFMAGQAIDRIDPGFAKRCTTNFPTMMEALVATNPKPLEIKPECIGVPAAPATTARRAS